MNLIQIQDPIYGEIVLDSPVILELVHTKVFERLKKISQFGIPDDYYHLKGYSRYSHSIGVYYLLKKFGASEIEQVAGLLHDVSHTAFSHLIDWVIGDSSKEDYQDKRHLSVLQSVELSSILQRYGFDPIEIADYSKFSLLEKEIPDICADRIDYAFREFPISVSKKCINGFEIVNSEFVFKNEQMAILFSRNFLLRQINHWSGYEALTRYVILSDLLKNAMKREVIRMSDLLIDDEFVINKINKAEIPMLRKVLELLMNQDLGFLEKQNYPTKKKFRYVDPRIKIGNKMKRLSEINVEYKTELEEARKRNDQGLKVGLNPFI